MGRAGARNLLISVKMNCRIAISSPRLEHWPNSNPIVFAMPSDSTTGELTVRLYRPHGAVAWHDSSCKTPSTRTEGPPA